MRKKNLFLYKHAKKNTKISHKNMLVPMFEWLFQCELQAQGRKKIWFGVK